MRCDERKDDRLGGQRAAEYYSTVRWMTSKWVGRVLGRNNLEGLGEVS
jgi:hypothetical protein